MLLCTILIMIYCFNTSTDNQHSQLFYYDSENGRYEQYKEAFNKKIENENVKNFRFKTNLTTDYPYKIEYSESSVEPNTHNDFVIEEILNNRNNDLYILSIKQDAKEETKIYYKLKLEVAEQIKSSKTIKNIAENYNVYSNINMQKIYNESGVITNTKICTIGISDLTAKYTQYIQKIYLPKYCFYSPFALGFFFSFEPILFYKIMFYRDKNLCEIFEILYMDYLFDYFLYANEKMLGKYNASKAIYESVQIENIHYKYDFMFKNPQFYNIMITLFNVEILQNFLSPNFYEFIVFLTNLTNYQMKNYEFCYNQNTLICFYVIVFSFFFVNDTNYYMLSPCDYYYSGIDDFFRKMILCLNSFCDVYEYSKSKCFSNFYKHVLQTKLLDILKRYNTTEQNHYINLLDSLLKNQLTYEQISLLQTIQIDEITGEFCYKTISIKNYKDENLDYTFYKLSVYVMFDVMFTFMAQKNH